ncbi:TPA: type 2 lantipeptide synthetase LanM family protein [Bacillus thuringiensis]|uniref:type 2 lanthipeptide synthetase LanM family protein n=1 Tax=Bacillus sp. CH_70 TaxID=2978215 RepID=UPI0030F7C134|nr:type 2 lantipeptide synthetase LanM family protein [Bacillus thuringiensis]
MSLKERYNILKTNFRDIEINKDALTRWRNRTNLVSNDNFILMMLHRRYEEKYFSHAIKGINKDNLNIFSKELLSSDWLEIYESAMKQLDIKDVEYDEIMESYYVIRPFLMLAKLTLEEFFVKNKKELAISKNVIPDLIRHLSTELLIVAQKSIVLELNVSKLKQELTGKSSYDKYHSFFKLYKSKERLHNFYNEYVELTRLLCTSTSFFTKNIIKLFKALLKHRAEVTSNFKINKRERIVHISLGQGDTHQQGQTVIKLEYSSGKVILFKPRDLRTTKVYNEFIYWLNSKKQVLQMPTYNVLCFSEYTFEEFINKKSCNNEKEIEDYYTRYGQLIAIMYLLRGNDFHMENLIANGEFPYIVDLETIIQNRVSYQLPNNAYSKARDKMLDLVSSTSLLPDNYHIGKDRVIDISALNGRGVKLPNQVEGPINKQTDDLKFGLIDIELPEANNIPDIQGKSVSYKNYINAIVLGYRETCKLFLKYKEELINERDGILKKFEGVKVRVILRPTAHYNNMLQSTYHPDYMRNSLDRESVLENIWAQPFLHKEVIISEYEDLMDNDIPIFFNYTNSCDLIDSKGNIYKNFFKETGFVKMKQNLIKMNNDEIEKQISVILVSTGNYKPKNQSSISTIKLKDSSNDVTPRINDIFIKKAEEIGELILESAINSEDNKTISWLTVNADPIQTWKIERIPGDLYDGLAGLVVFYYNLYKCTKNIKYRHLCDVLIQSAKDRLAITDLNYSCIAGKSSLLYPVIQIFTDEGDSQYKEYIDNAINEFCTHLNEDTSYDWIQGSPSFLQLIMNLYTEIGEVEYLNSSIRIGNHLLKQLKKSNEKLIGGFAHGASSIAYVLMRLGHLSKKEIFTKKAIELLRYDQSFYRQDKGGWLDARDTTPTFKNFWCHGSIGIGLSRIKIKDFYSDFQIDQEINTALETTLNSYYVNDDTLCHGNMGKTELFLNMYQQSKEKKYLELSENVALTIIRTGEYQSRSIKGFPAIGLFTGLSGIGYQLLRISNPEKVPSLLTFS